MEVFSLQSKERARGRADPQDEEEERHSPSGAAGGGKEKPGWTTRGKSDVIGPKIKVILKKIKIKGKERATFKISGTR